MATMEDLQDVLTSVDASMREQTTLLQDILGIQKSIFESQKRAEEKNKVSRTEAEPRGDTSGAPDSGSDAEKITFDFDKLGMIGTAFSLAVGTTIGLVTGQLKAIRTFFKAFVPGLVKTFDDFKTGVATRFIDLMKDLRIRFAFIRVAVEETVTNSLASIKNLFGVTEDSNIGKIIKGVKSAITTLIAPFSSMINTIKALTAADGPVGFLQKTFQGIKNLFGSLGGTISSVAKVVGKIFAPIAIIITAFDTIKGALDGYAEGGILGGFKGAIDGFFTSLVTIPLDLIKDMVAWVVGALGFDETSEAIKSFSFTKLWTDMTGAIFGGIQSAIDWIKTLFSDPSTALKQLWSGLYGEGGIVDMIWYPVNLAIDWITKKLGWSEEDAPTFSMMGFFGDVFNTIKEKFIAFGDYVSGIPDRIALEAKGMWIDLKEKLKLGFLDLAEWLASIPNKMLAMVMNLLGAVQFTVPNWVPRIGGNVLRLIDQESVDAANAAANEVNPSFERQRQEIFATASGERGRLANEIERLETSALAGNTTTVVMAPNNSQTNISSTGGTASSTTVVAGGSRSDLDTLGHRGAQ